MPTALKYIRDHIRARLSIVYDPEETETLSRELISHCFGIQGVAYLITEHVPLQEFEVKANLEEPLQRLLNHEPIQHITQHVDFLDLKIKVSPDVLIPRPETEELAQLIINRHKNNRLKNVTNLCTGSGCIAIALAKHLQVESVHAYDLSPEAIRVATENNIGNDAGVKFYEADILEQSFALHQDIDLLVSNPPYVLEREKAEMQPNVLRHEPHLALFVPDADPLLFYRRIKELADKYLKKNGSLWLEINEKYGEETAGIFKTYNSVSILSDFRGRARFLVVQK